MGKHQMFVAKFYCCKEWPIVLGNIIGTCGLCGERPVRGPDPAYLVDDLEVE